MAIEATSISWVGLPPSPGTGIEPSAPALPVRAAVEAAVEHDAAADEGADVEIDEVAQRCRSAEHQLGAAGRGGVVLQIDREGALRLHLGADVAVAPCRP